MAAESPSSRAGFVPAPTLASAVTLATAALCWAVVVSQPGSMGSMGMGLGSPPSFMGTWTVMMAAMMLPSALPLVRAYAGLPGRNPWPIDTGLLVAAYLAVWALFGVGAYYVSSALGTRWPSSDRSLGIALCIASLYALTPVKQRFGIGCRSICSQLTARVGTEAITTGVSYGLNCVGCSVGVMVVMLVAGLSNLVWMVIVTAIVLLYKVVLRNRRQNSVIALITLVAGIWLAAFPVSVPMLLMPGAHA